MIVGEDGGGAAAARRDFQASRFSFVIVEKGPDLSHGYGRGGGTPDRSSQASSSNGLLVRCVPTGM